VISNNEGFPVAKEPIDEYDEVDYQFDYDFSSAIFT
jgi:hypothetical protein